MNIPCIAKPAYCKQLDAILAALDEADEEMKKAGSRIGEHVFKEIN